MEKKKIIINDHEAVDLGLSVKWAAYNIGASNPEEYGDYFAFGETEPKDEYTEENYMLYGIPHGEAYIGIGKIISGTEYDAASKQWGDDWRMPTEEELYELLSFCSWQWMTINGVNGYRVIGPNGNSIWRTRQTLWSAVQMLTQKLCCQTIHDCPKVVPLHYESE